MIDPFAIFVALDALIGDALDDFEKGEIADRVAFANLTRSLYEFAA